MSGGLGPIAHAAMMQATTPPPMVGQALGGIGFFFTATGQPVSIKVDAAYGISVYVADSIYLDAQYKLAVTVFLVLNESLSFSDADTQKSIVRAVMTEALAFADTDSFKSVARTALSEALTLNDAQTSRAVATVLLVDSLLVGDAASSNAPVISYVVNANTSAVSTYDGFTFNSMTKIDGVYYGMDADGLHMIGGADDNGAVINPVVKTGEMSLAVDKVAKAETMKRVSFLYLGGRTSLDMNVAVTANGETNTYQLAATTAQVLQATRLNMSRGVVARYWTFEFSSPAGGDIDIESVVLSVTELSRRIRG